MAANENSIRARLARMEPGQSKVFICPAGRAYGSLQREIAAALSKHFPTTAIRFSQRKALLVIDEHTPPTACSIVTYRPED